MDDEHVDPELLKTAEAVSDARHGMGAAPE